MATTKNIPDIFLMLLLNQTASNPVKNTGKTRSATSVERRATLPGSAQMMTKTPRRRRPRAKARPRMMSQTMSPRPAKEATRVPGPSPARKAKAVPLRRKETKHLPLWNTPCPSSKKSTTSVTALMIKSATKLQEWIAGRDRNPSREIPRHERPTAKKQKH
jgi:hypothetical protein